MRLIVKILLPLLVLALCVTAARAVIANRPEPQSRPQFKTSTAIDAIRLKPESYTVTLKTRGEVSSAAEGALVAGVDGSIINISDNFVVGGSFQSGDVLAQIDPRDYQIALTLAQAGYAEAQAALSEVQALSEQAAADWRSLGRRGNPSDLTLRKPQLAAASANVEGALGQVQRAELDLERTNIRTLYDGQVRAKQVSLGQYVNRGATLADVFATAAAEIRLPFTSSQLQYLDIDNQVASKQPVVLQATVGGTDTEWSAFLARAEGIDPNNRQFYVVAKVDNPYQLDTPLRIGQYVEAEVTGKTLNNVFVIPRSALREDTNVLIVDELGTLQRRDVVVAWKDAEVAVISDGLNEGDVLNTTALGSVTDGTRVKATIDGVAPQKEPRGKPEGGQRQNSNQNNNQAGSIDKSIDASGNEGDRMQRLKAMVDAGQPLPPQAVERIQASIDAGEEVPAWLKNHIQATAK